MNGQNGVRLTSERAELDTIALLVEFWSRLIILRIYFECRFRTCWLLGIFAPVPVVEKGIEIVLRMNMNMNKSDKIRDV